MNITPIPDRAHEPQAEPCATHEVRIHLLVTATVCEGTEARHVLEYIRAHLGNREPDLHEDIFDELEGATMHVQGQEVPEKQEKHTLGCAIACARWFSEGNELCSTCAKRQIKHDEGKEQAA